MSMLRAGLCDGLTDRVVQSLRGARVRTVTDLMTTDLELLVTKCGISFKELLSIRRLVKSHFSAPSLNGCDIYTRALASMAILPTGCANLDQLLDGGLYTGELTELVGHSAVGKTQLCHSTAVAIVKETKQYVLYIDTCGSFSPDRLLEIVEGYEDAETILSNIHCCRAFDVFQLLALLDETRQNVIDQVNSFHVGLRLVICDSVPAVITPVLGGQQTGGHCLMMHVAHKLKALAADFSLAVLIANNVVGKETDSRTASLGPSWQPVPHMRLLLHTASSSDRDEIQRQMTILKSCRLATNVSTKFEINSTGFGNPRQS